MHVALALAGAAALLAGCGAGSSAGGGGVAHLAAGSPASAAPGSATTGSGAGSPAATALAFAACMRAHGVPDFPDPAAGGGFLFQAGAGVDPSSPAFAAAQAKCKRFLPHPGSGPPPSTRTVARMLRIARCMRVHGVPDFPDPRTSVPSDLRVTPHTHGELVISDIEGVILVFDGIDTRSAAFTRAAGACRFPLHDH